MFQRSFETERRVSNYSDKFYNLIFYFYVLIIIYFSKN